MELEAGIFQLGAGYVFHNVYKEELIAAKNVTLYINASAAEPTTEGSGETVKRVKFAHSGSEQVFFCKDIYFGNMRL